jgi:hypothetical protein
VLKRHVLSVHLKQRNYSCDRCGQTFSENHVLKRHWRAVHGNQSGGHKPQRSPRKLVQQQQQPLPNPEFPFPGP